MIMVRPEEPRDVPAISAVHAAAFAEPERPGRIPPEVELVEGLRRSDAWLSPFSLVAVVDDRVRGHVLCTRAWVGGRPALALGPIGVTPEFQGQVIGSDFDE